MNFLLLLLSLVVSQRTIRTPIAVVVDGDTLIISPDSIASTDSGFFIKGIDWDVDSITFADDTLRLFQNGEEKAKAFIEASKDSSWVAIEVDDIDSKSATEINVKDDLVIDSTLTVEVVPFVYMMKPIDNKYYATCQVASGGTVFHQCGRADFFLNQFDCDSVVLDSFRSNCIFYGDSVALYSIYFRCYEIVDNETYDEPSNAMVLVDSLYLEDGGTPGSWRSKAFVPNFNEAIIPPFYMSSSSLYFHNRTASTVQVRVYSHIWYGRAFYTKK